MNRKKFLAALGFAALAPAVITKAAESTQEGTPVYVDKLEAQKERIKSTKRPPYRKGEIVINTTGQAFLVIAATEENATIKALDPTLPIFVTAYGTIVIQHGHPDYYAMFSIPGEGSFKKESR